MVRLRWPVTATLALDVAVTFTVARTQPGYFSQLYLRCCYWLLHLGYIAQRLPITAEHTFYGYYHSFLRLLTLYSYVDLRVVPLLLRYL